jgi:hypothetical protein
MASLLSLKILLVFLFNIAELSRPKFEFLEHQTAHVWTFVQCVILHSNASSSTYQSRRNNEGKKEHKI